MSGHGEDKKGPLFRPVKNDMTKGLDKPLEPDGIYKMLRRYAQQVAIDTDHFSPHSLRATAATNTLEHEADRTNSVSAALSSARNCGMFIHRRKVRTEAPTAFDAL